MKFFISVVEQRSTVVEINADSDLHAVEKAEDAYYAGKICMDSEAYLDDGTCFYDETDYWSLAAAAGLVDFQEI